ncbi:AraC family transcriptional regulator [Microbacterium gorillae]|uniref:AraC family transcriptional regulator n=1 Tax=Microbacterium gorillae TaxID=1231063 RepID=UPI00058B6E4A|nr:AraC family transcriptional regulator [Microbacterium gorillae]
MTSTPDRLEHALHTVRMRSVFCSRAELGAPWALEMPVLPDAISFHTVVTGHCWVRLSDGELIEVRAGDLVLVPHGRGHELRSHPEIEEGPRVDLLPQEYLTPQYSLVRHGGTGARTQLLCGIVSFDEPAARELLRALPTTLLVRGEDQSLASGVRDILRLLAGELTRPQVGGDAVATRLADLLVIEAIRQWLSEDDAAGTGWLGAMRDPRIGAALDAVHDDPGREWTLELLARSASLSRSAFSARFTEVVGVAPMAYVTRWRMTLAHSRLTTERTTVSALAGELGYRSEAAFTRAFTRVIGRTPGATRRSASE